MNLKRGLIQFDRVSRIMQSRAAGRKILSLTFGREGEGRDEGSFRFRSCSVKVEQKKKKKKKKCSAGVQSGRNLFTRLNLESRVRKSSGILLLWVTYERRWREKREVRTRLQQGIKSGSPNTVPSWSISRSISLANSNQFLSIKVVKFLFFSF